MPARAIPRAIKKANSRLAGSLRTRVLFLTLAAFALIAVPACLCFVWIVNSTVIKLGTLFAEKQILYDRYRGLETLMREVGLAETLARSPAVIDWARDEDHAAKRARGINELEHFRASFRDKSYFFVAGASGNYYYNDAQGAFTGNQYRYTLSPDNPRDGWYYRTAALGPGCQLNVDNDDVLAVTKVWINCVVADRGSTLGIIGTGIDLSTFIRDVVNSSQPGVESIFVDRNGAIQASRDRKTIDFHSLTKLASDRKTVFRTVDTEADRQAMTRMMDYVASGPERVQARFMTMQGRDVLVGIGYLDRLGWYNVTLMEVDQIIDRRLFLPIAALFAVMMLGAAILVTWLFKRSVLDRLARVEAAMASIETDAVMVAAPEEGDDEIARLARTMNSMARTVRDNRSVLEAAVRDRTAELERIAFLDGMTSIPNRRAYTRAFAAARLDPAAHPAMGIVIFDVDNFKSINDSLGHTAGDEVIRAVADRLVAATPPNAICARWGGDEFVLLLSQCDRDLIEALAARLSLAIVTRPIIVSGHAPVPVTVSIGAHLVGADEDFDDAVHCADVALYAAKREGRNRWVVYERARHIGIKGPTRVA